MAFHVFSLAHNNAVIFSLYNLLTMSEMSKFITDQTTFQFFTNMRLLRDTRARDVYFLSFFKDLLLNLNFRKQNKPKQS